MLSVLQCEAMQNVWYEMPAATVPRYDFLYVMLSVSQREAMQNVSKHGEEITRDDVG